MRNVFGNEVHKTFGSMIDCFALLQQISHLEDLSLVNKQMYKNKNEVWVQCSSLCRSLKGLSVSVLFSEKEVIIKHYTGGCIHFCDDNGILRLQQAMLPHGCLSAYSGEMLWYNFKMLAGKVNSMLYTYLIFFFYFDAATQHCHVQL